MTENILIKYIIGQADDVQAQLIQNWLSESEENKKRIAQLKDCWILSGLSQEVDIAMKNQEIKKILRKIKLRKRTEIGQKLQIVKYAAAIVLIVALSSTAGIFFSKSIFTNNDQVAEIIVPSGERSQLVLPDGSTVKLNGNSKLKFPVHFNKKDRTVFLEGEAFFDVTHQPSKPFIVKTSAISIEVLGTKFNVSSYANDPYILAYLETGKIKISGASIKNKSYFLSPSEAFKFDKTSTEFSKTIINDKRYSDWTKGILTVKGETIEELAKKLERRFNIQIYFSDEEIKTHTYSGSIKDEELKTVLEALKFTSSLNYSINGKKVNLLSR